MPIVPYVPKPIAPAASSTSTLSLVGTMFTALAAPEVGVPAFLAQLAVTLATPEKFAAYMSACADFTHVVKNTLEAYKLLRDLGFVGESTDCCERIIKALHTNYGESNQRSIAQIFEKALLFNLPVEGSPDVEVGLTESIRAIYGTLYYHLDNTTVITLTDALARMVLTGLVRTYQGVPQSPTNP